MSVELSCIAPHLILLLSSILTDHQGLKYQLRILKEAIPQQGMTDLLSFLLTKNRVVAKPVSGAKSRQIMGEKRSLLRVNEHRKTGSNDEFESETLFRNNSNEKIPVAPISGLGEGLDTTQHYWLRADPVQLQVDLSTLYYDPITPSWTLSELQGLITQLQILLEPWQIHLYTPSINRWYLSMPFDPGLNMTPLEGQSGKVIQIEDCLEEGIENKGVPWGRLLTEIQMVLHESSAAFNSLWCWGGGALPPQQVVPSKDAWTGVWTNDPFAKGLALLQTYPVYSLEDNLNFKEKILGFKRYLWAESTSNALTKPLLEEWVLAVRRGFIQTLYLYDGKGTRCRITPSVMSRLWHPWRWI